MLNELTKLKGRQRIFRASREGKFGDEYLPTAEKLTLKACAQVMMLIDDRAAAGSTAAWAKYWGSRG